MHQSVQIVCVVFYSQKLEFSNVGRLLVLSLPQRVRLMSSSRQPVNGGLGYRLKDKNLQMKVTVMVKDF